MDVGFVLVGLMALEEEVDDEAIVVSFVFWRLLVDADVGSVDTDMGEVWAVVARGLDGVDILVRWLIE